MLAEVAHEFSRLRAVLEHFAQNVRVHCSEEFLPVGEDVVLPAFDVDLHRHARPLAPI